jgi:hypothetical protein
MSENIYTPNAHSVNPHLKDFEEYQENISF